MSRLARLTQDLADDCSGVAAIEMSLIASMFCVALLNVVDLARYAYVRTQAASATQAAVQAAYTTCDPAHLPATVNCPDLSAAVTSAVQGTSLGSRVALSGPIAEAYYCLNSSGALQYASDLDNKPADCSALGNASAKPQLYVRINTTMSYTSVFGSLSIASTFPANVTNSAWMRMS